MNFLSKPLIAFITGVSLLWIFFFAPIDTWGAKKEEKKTVKIGFITEESGQGFPVALAQKKALEIAVEEINASGGFLGRRVKVITRDTGSDPDRGEALARDLILREGVDFLIGPTSPPAAWKVSEVCKAYKKIIVFHTPLPERPILDGGDRHLFRVAPSAAMEGRAAALILAARPIHNIALITPENELGQNRAQAFKKRIEELKPSARIVKEIWIKNGEQEVVQAVQELLSTPVEAIYASLGSGALARLIRHGRANGLFPKVHLIGRFDYDLFKNLGEDMMPLQMGYDPAPFYAYSDRRLKSFVRKYRLRSEEFPSAWAVTIYDALIALRKAVEKAKSLETNKVISALEGLQWDSLRGPLTLRPRDHQADCGIYHGIAAKDTRLNLYTLKNLQYIPWERLQP